VYELFERVAIPIIGMGGVEAVQDVVDFMACGAKVVAVGSCGLRDPGLVGSLVEGLAGAMQNRGLTPAELVGKAHFRL
jgi:dihydroorotate dehydrogenase (NAD+) catalytic subunit